MMDDRTEKRPLSKEEVAEIVNGLEVDWTRIHLLGSLPPGKRLLPALQAQAFAMSALRGTFRKRFPSLSRAETNLKVLSYLTPVRMVK